MAWNLIQNLNNNERQIVLDEIDSYLNSFNMNLRKKNNAPNNNNIILRFTFGVGNSKTIFQCMQNDNISNQGAVCLYDNANEQGKIIFARKMDFGKALDVTGADNAFFDNNLRMHFQDVVIEYNYGWEKVGITDEIITEHPRFVIFELDHSGNGQNTPRIDFEARLNAFFEAQQHTRQKPRPDLQEKGCKENDVISYQPIMAKIRSALTAYRNIILEGVPGTGKTWYARKLSASPEEGAQQRDEQFVARWITFHPAVAYEDFVEGIRPGADRSNAMVGRRWFWENGGVGDGGGFAVRDGFFLRVCQEACRNPRQNYLVVIDEINRANLPNVLGDLLTLLEKDKRVSFPGPGEAFEPNDDSWVTLPYSGRRFAVPDNVYVLGTMNSSDRSIAPIDAALRRRFAFLTIEPMPASALCAKVPSEVHRSVEQWDRLNGLLADCLGPDGRLGHSYLLQLGERIKPSKGIDRNGSSEVIEPKEAIRLAWQLELLPQLIDTLTTHGAIELFAADDGRVWLGAREQQASADHEVVKNFRDFIKLLGFDLVLQGDGHGKGLRVVPTGTETDEPAASAAFAEAAE